MFRFLLVVLTLCFLVVNTESYAAETEEEFVGDPIAFGKWLADFKNKALEQGISSKTLDIAFKDIKINPKVIRLDRKQPYKTKTFDQYITSVVPESRVNKARKKYSENKELLDSIAEKYGVQARFIVALWGIESNFGQNMGSLSIVESLSTLAFEGRRREFFQKELINALKIIDQGHITHDRMVGSWAGAMGQTQFMPSSFLKLAVDHDGDGKKDIWHNKADAFASIANYLSNLSWDDDTTWGREVLLPKGFDNNLLGRKTVKTIKEWNDLEIRNIAGDSLPLKRGDIKASIIKPEDDGSRVYMVYGNYKKILKWNRSLYFATAVGILSDKIGRL